jgi:hypothetical protein
LLNVGTRVSESVFLILFPRKEKECHAASGNKKRRVGIDLFAIALTRTDKTKMAGRN